MKARKVADRSRCSGISGWPEPRSVVARRDLTEAWPWIRPVSRVSKSPESYRARERDLAVSAAAIMPEQRYSNGDEPPHPVDARAASLPNAV
jgi:hypothetical protein